MTVRKRGKTYQAQVRVREGGEIVYSESATRDTKAAATLWKLTTMEEIKRSGWRSRVVSTRTVGQTLEAHAELRRRSKGMSRGMEHSVDTLAHGPLGQLTWPALTPERIVEWAMKRHEAGNAPSTVMHHLAALLATARAAPALLGVTVDPAPVTLAIKQLKQLRVAAPSVKRDQRVTDADLAKVCEVWAKEEREIPMPTIARLMIEFPRRREEVLTMERKHLAADGSTIKLIDTKDPRKYREEIVPVPPPAHAILVALPDLGPTFLPYKPESVSAAWQRAVRRAGLAHLRLHDLRHEGISRLFERGLSIEEVALISGHTSWATLKRYTHLRPQDVTAKLRSKQ